MTSSPADFFHVSVFAQELVEAINPKPHGHYLDATLGGGGHTEILLGYDDTITMTVIDLDENAIASVRDRLPTSYLERITFFHGNFADFQGQKNQFDGVMADLGVSSPQFDHPERGFSFRHEGALDMRMNQNQSLTAQKIVNHWQEKEIADLIYQYGEERLSRRIARKIVEKRPFTTTTQLASAIALCYPPKARYGRIHPATRTFQALRIAVNQELDSLTTFLGNAPRWLKPEGRIAIISFHSLEDRIVKYQFRDNDALKIITKKPLTPSKQEQEVNGRSRSAKLRIAEKQ
ncbi:16S rRNA (cytosine(1402)-N(4))-methyltransferase RsmH [Cyanobacterium stanieri LEGE 03274]|uniref:Ribosomal RNA small subunit methyltransferase H n=1 Tax=Cyanobacterium stanieri LEGE 03274 TaxID=1828756 RepID=A0ABR9V2N7_9CHRO|nr:16S rRNA (cytosine(1402)-N(4))-methyltransferase RsmH [Cyanobacterium stanieri]MBE9221814.1 16S rRNA (cytosine(1402)-N(4))-methyltransferase RsmH [Cyanobacterium stanieri LEGE 03274]